MFRRVPCRCPAVGRDQYCVLRRVVLLCMSASLLAVGTQDVVPTAVDCFTEQAAWRIPKVRRVSGRQRPVDI